MVLDPQYNIQQCHSAKQPATVVLDAIALQHAPTME